MVLMTGIKKMFEEDDLVREKTQKQMAELIENGKIHDKLDFLMRQESRIEEHLEAMNGSIKDHECRLRDVEKGYFKASGGIAVVSVAATILSIVAITKTMGLW
jgi:hypothetical protein